MTHTAQRFTWAKREQPILEAIYAFEEDGTDRIHSADLAARVGLTESDAQVSADSGAVFASTANETA